MHALILMSDTGGGHRALSRAIAAEIESSGGCATIFDAFQAGHTGLAGRVLGLYGPLIRRAPGLYGFAFDLLDAEKRFRWVARGLGGAVASRVALAVATHRPDVVVFAHALAVVPGLDALQLVKEREGFGVPAVAMVTELATVHCSWVDCRVTRYLAATQGVQAGLAARGVPRERIALTGLPVGPRFGRIEESVEEVRLRLRLAPRRTTALILSGGEGSGPLEVIVPALAQALPELQIVVVCGRNRHLAARLERHGLPPTVRLFAFVDNMAELMHAADFVLTKGGPQTISETLAAGRPVVITDLLPGQERGNGAYVVRHGAGYLALSLPNILAAARRLASDADERQRLAAAARAIGPRVAAAAVAGELREVAGTAVA